MQIAFHTANYFAKFTNYQTSMDEWGKAERLVIENFSLAEFDRMCTDIAKAGFQHIELWMGHAFPKFMTPYFADELKAIWEKHGLAVISYSCSLGDPNTAPRWTRLCFETTKMLGIKMITSGITKDSAEAVHALCKEYDIKVAVENHPEKHPGIIRDVIGSYGDYLGAAVDTGWYETQGFKGHEALLQLKDHLFHVHLKDVEEVGAHTSTALGSGVLDVPACLRVLQKIGYQGFVSLEQESADHDPTEDCIKALKMVEEILG